MLSVVRNIRLCNNSHALNNKAYRSTAAIKSYCNWGILQLHLQQNHSLSQLESYQLSNKRYFSSKINDKQIDSTLQQSSTSTTSLTNNRDSSNNINNNNNLLYSLNSIIQKYEFDINKLKNNNDILISFPDQHRHLLNQLKSNRNTIVNNNKLSIFSRSSSENVDAFQNVNIDNELLGRIVETFFENKQYKSMFWAQQVLPRAFQCNGESIKDIVQDCFRYVYPMLFMAYTHSLAMNRPFKFIINSFINEDYIADKQNQSSSSSSSSSHSLGGRSNLIESLLLKELKQTRKSIYNSLLKKQDQLDLPDNQIETPYIVQLYLERSNRLFVSISKANFSKSFGWSLPLPFPAGAYQFPLDKKPPSRAYMKMLEIFGHMGRRPTKQVVELGSAPGGWTSRLLDMNESLEIQSVDRSPLESWITKAYKPPRLAHHIANGMTWRPAKPTDWLMNDMALPPLKSLEVLEEWLSKRLCQTFVWTLKFVGETDYENTIIQIKNIMSKYKVEYTIRHLVHHGNELVIIGSFIE
ncbi:hypothetical protein PPL_05735 [Heterostelium album PN500]|uniref:Ribosomal RNA methyltransferase FtsJ domain-containing protein n=1 Tax=Heterostelium pallidum (strain ATCC 26659 / Pp 5 / PN500) TaxID=670386 RepID=D3BB04_HETP5|nr:hypothetical protein PPL_05735 [Heterostelium album PN500]EFA81741.1 hypothetical protein PPL_05735 [Heterostelium album PN500]|eukprot:XP_020433858.1 hypothetical protein PPL_05735 [Heterostelium album PN500]